MKKKKPTSTGSSSARPTKLDPASLIHARLPAKEPPKLSRSEATHYMLLDAFSIDNDSLEGVSPRLVFCYGVEWAWVRDAVDQLRDGAPAVTLTVHVKNTPRLVALAERHGLHAYVEMSPSTTTKIQISRRSAGAPKPC